MRPLITILLALPASLAAGITSILPDLYHNQVAYTASSNYNPYFSKTSNTPNVTTWIQIDLDPTGTAAAPSQIESIGLYPLTQMHLSEGPVTSYGFPVRYKVEIDSNANFSSNQIMLVDCTQEDQPNAADTMVVLPVSANITTGSRYLRFTATVLGSNGGSNEYQLILSKISAWDRNGYDIAENKTLTVDAQYGNPGLVTLSDSYWSLNNPTSSNASHLTRPARPMGGGIETNNSANVIRQQDWNPPKLGVSTPMSGVQLDSGGSSSTNTTNSGVFLNAMANNVGYLLNDGLGSVGALTKEFLDRAGLPSPNVTYPPNYWNTLPGSNAGRFLMGAANTLRWMDNATLNSRIDAVLAAINQSAESNGYIMAYAEDQIFVGEHAAYTRSWVTHGLLTAGYTGYTIAFDLLRGFYDWYNRYPYIHKLLRGGGQGGQGQVANTLVARSPVGKPEDLYVVQQYFQEDYWIQGLTQQDTSMIWEYPYDHSHTYLGTNVEAYLDQYLITGNKKYLDMVLGYWQMIHDHWLHIGGSTAITEFGEFPPDSYRLDPDTTGELCGNSFWIRINQRLHWLFPDEEKYTAQIEKSLYNVVLANQDGDTGFLYHAELVGTKDFDTTGSPYGENINTCCEGSGTRTVGSLPEFIFSTAEDGLYINLFQSATITWPVGGQNITLRMESQFPFDNNVTLTIAAMPISTSANIRIRIPSWATQAIPISLNNTLERTGTPGSYLSLNQTWKVGDTVKFQLPADYNLTEYTGWGEIQGHTRYGIEYGPILMAVTGPDQASLTVTGSSADALFGLLNPLAGEPLHSYIENNEGYTLMPYWQVSHENFTCLPVIDVQET